ncbi:MAG: AAA family ATPase [Prosthecobacter sp.]|nr:AAA family ATPase [Prosthecobacter sp.]
MIREFTIENFKSIESLTLPLGRVTVLIGENGAGKSNVLEAMAFFGSAVHNKLDAEFLVARGVRVCANTSILTAFESKPSSWKKNSFQVGARGGKDLIKLIISDLSQLENGESGWAASTGEPLYKDRKWGVLEKRWMKYFNAGDDEKLKTQPKTKQERLRWMQFLEKLASETQRAEKKLKTATKLLSTPFVIYSPENTALRTFESESQMRPLGVRGEGLFKLVQYLAKHQPAKFKLLRKELKLFDWFEDFAIPKRLGIGESRLEIKDRFLAAKRLLDQRSANEGFLFLLFYLCLFLSPQTPKFFAIDNIDASLNPKLCAEMMRRLVALAKQEDKQVIITTHNPAILDGLDLTDKEQLLYAIQRDEKGRTIAQRIPAPKPQRGEPALKLSHAYLRGLLGGVPKNF